MDKLKNILRKKKKEIERIQNQDSEEDEINLKKRDLDEYENKKEDDDEIKDNSKKIIEEIIQNFKKEKKIEIKEDKENIIKEWDFEINEKDLKTLNETNNILKSKLKTCQKYYPKMDYLKKEADYIQRSNQLKHFIIFSINNIENELLNIKKDNFENKEKKQNDFKILEKVKKDIQYLFLYLNEFVS